MAKFKLEQRRFIVSRHSNMKIPIICMLFTVAPLVAGGESLNEENGSLEQKEWRRKAIEMFEPSECKKDAKSSLSYEEVKREIQLINSQLKKNDGLRESLSKKVISRVEFWTRAIEFEPSFCSTAHEARISGRYTRLCVADMKTFTDGLLRELERYCLGIVEELVYKPLRAIPERELNLLSWMIEDGRPNRVDFSNAAKYLAPYVPEPEKVKSRHAKIFPRIEAQTQEAFDKALRGKCEIIDGLPRQSRIAIEYFRYKEHLIELDELVPQWAAAKNTCDILGKNLDALALYMPKAILAHYNLTKEDMYEPIGFVKKLKGCFKPNCN